MPKKIDFSNTAITDRMIQFSDDPMLPEKFRGFKLPILDPVYNLRYTDAIDFDGGQVVYSHEIVNGNTLPTLNDLVELGRIKDWFPYEITDMQFNWKGDNNPKYLNLEDFGQDSNKNRLSIPKIVKWFAERGVKVSPKAIRHNYEAWRADLKSGYRDERNGIHVFTPCGCNPLSFRVTTLHPTAEDWQETYEC